MEVFLCFVSFFIFSRTAFYGTLVDQMGGARNKEKEGLGYVMSSEQRTWYDPGHRKLGNWLTL